jgi:hypothetical protein
MGWLVFVIAARFTSFPTKSNANGWKSTKKNQLIHTPRCAYENYLRIHHILECDSADFFSIGCAMITRW